MNDYNEGIIGIIRQRNRGDRGVAEVVYQSLLERWPQINRETKVSYVPHYQREVIIGQTPPVSAVWRWVENWRYWQRQLFPPFELDAPDIRWIYQKSVFRFIRRFPLLLWRWVTGKMREDDLPSVEIAIHEERIALDVLSWQLPYGVGRMKCGYAASRDTFFMQRQQPDSRGMDQFAGDDDILRTFKFGGS